MANFNVESGYTHVSAIFVLTERDWVMTGTVRTTGALIIYNKIYKQCSPQRFCIFLFFSVMNCSLS